MDNHSGIRPVDVKVLVLPDKVPEKEGSIIVPESARDRLQMGQTRGTLIAVGEGAFQDWYEIQNYNREESREPKPGARVIIDRYAGVKVDGADGLTYQLINDKDLLAVLSKEKQE